MAVMAITITLTTTTVTIITDTPIITITVMRETNTRGVVMNRMNIMEEGRMVNIMKGENMIAHEHNRHFPLFLKRQVSVPLPREFTPYSRSGDKFELLPTTSHSPFIGVLNTLQAENGETKWKK